VRIDFYHLTATPLERVLPSIAEKVIAAGQRLLVVTQPGRIAELDRQLWSYAPESFLPHAAAGGPRDAGQPILIAADTAAPNGARNIALADGRWRDEALGFDRIFYFFDAGAVDDARANWRALKDVAGADRHYWKQDERGRWEEGP
jgi:DNA polymerase III subunit chi